MTTTLIDEGVETAPDEVPDWSPWARFESHPDAWAKLRGHATRTLIRVVCLIIADSGVVALARYSLGVLRSTSSSVETALPSGTLGGARFVVGIILGLAILGAYRTGDRWRSWNRTFRGVGLGTALALWGAVWASPGLAVVRWAVVSLGIALGVAVVRRILSSVVSYWRRDESRREGVVLVGLERELDSARRHRLFGPSAPFAARGAIPIDPLGSSEQIADQFRTAVARADVSSVIVAGDVPSEVWMRLVEEADTAGLRLLSVSRHSGPFVTSLRQTSYHGIPVTEITRPHLRFPQLVLKRVFDLVVGSALIVVSSPVLLVLALAVKLTSRGPVLFRQERVGQAGHCFQILKFRSMVTDAEAQLDGLRSESIYQDGRLFKMERDPRVTRVGRFLRSTSLDELPQLLNVVRGEMSLVGPRPPVPREVHLYESHHYCRFEVKPGITGPWQVGGRNDITDFEEVILLEQEYIRNWNLGRDMKILLETIPVVLTRRGAV